jgi:hypothetical protein
MLQNQGRLFLFSHDHSLSFLAVLGLLSCYNYIAFADLMSCAILAECAIYVLSILTVICAGTKTLISLRNMQSKHPPLQLVEYVILVIFCTSVCTGICPLVWIQDVFLTIYCHLCN